MGRDDGSNHLAGGLSEKPKASHRDTETQRKTKAKRGHSLAFPIILELAFLCDSVTLWQNPLFPATC
jgi:hypothetical protein